MQLSYTELEKYHTVSRETYDRLNDYLGLLEEWNQTIRLVSNVSSLWEDHFLDAIQLSESIESDIVDLGSGGGLPAIILAIMTPYKITLIESDRRKAIFLQHCINTLALKNAEVFCERAESHQRHYPALTAQALAPLDKLLTYTYSLLSLDGVAFFPKGRQWESEIIAAKTKWAFDCEVISSKTKEGVILKIKTLRSK